MELSAAGIIAAVGILLGLNFIGLFVATYMFDRKATYALYYLAGTTAFIANGAVYLLSTLAPHPAPFLVLGEMFQSLGFIAASLGFERAFSLGLSKRFLWSLFATSALSAVAVSGLNEIDVLRQSVVSFWHIAIIAYVATTLFRLPESGFKHRFLAILLCGVALATANQVVTSAVIQAFYTQMSYAEQLATYGAIASTAHVTALFGFGAGLVFHVMSDLAAEYRNASITDSLTGLLNRRGFIDAVSHGETRPAALVMLDIDRFKAINDTYGHNAGDRVITAVAALMMRAAPSPHLCGRLGGEEFAILLQRAELATAEAVAQSLRTAIEIELDGFVAEDHSVTASFGVALVRDGDIDKALVAADHALYAAKRSGRNMVCVEGGERRTGSRAARMPSKAAVQAQS